MSVCISVPAGAPGQPNVDKITKDSVDLSWQKPSNDGGKKPTAYIIQKKSKGGNWEPCKEVPGNETNCTVPNLKEKDEVQFRVIAVNEAGEGEPSRPTSMNTVEEQPGQWLQGLGQFYFCRDSFKISLNFSSSYVAFLLITI